jgi:hypothetical protein
MRVYRIAENFADPEDMGLRSYGRTPLKTPLLQLAGGSEVRISFIPACKCW